MNKDFLHTISTLKNYSIEYFSENNIYNLYFTPKKTFISLKYLILVLNI